LIDTKPPQPPQRGTARSQNNQMRILFVSTNLPIPTNNGRAIRSLSIIGGLVSCGHEVTFLSFAGKSRPEMLYPLSSYCREIDLLEWELTSFSQDSDYLGRIGSL